MTTIAQKPALSLRDALKVALSGIASVLATVAAAGAVSAAIENRRQPKEADLHQLGMDGVTFNLSY